MVNDILEINPIEQVDKRHAVQLDYIGYVRYLNHNFPETPFFDNDYKLGYLAN